MRKRVLAVVFAAAVVSGGMAVTATAEPGNGNGPGPHGPNNWGLCNAWSHSGNNTGRAFQELRETAGDSDGNGTPNQDSDILAWCDENGQKPGNGGGGQ